VPFLFATSLEKGYGLSGWLVYLAIPAIVGSLLVIGGGLFISYFAIRFFLSVFAFSKPHLASFYFGYFWMGSVLAIVGYLISEFGYQLNFREAPGIWGQPGKPSTMWGRLQYIFPPLGFAFGVVFNAVLEYRMRSKAQSVRIGITVLSSFLLIVTFILSTRHSWETLG